MMNSAQDLVPFQNENHVKTVDYIQYPDEIWLHILSFLPIYQLDAVFQVDSHLHNLCITLLKKYSNDKINHGIKYCSQHLLFAPDMSYLIDQQYKMPLLTSIVIHQNLSMLKYFRSHFTLDIEDNKEFFTLIGYHSSTLVLNWYFDNGIPINYSKVFNGAVAGNHKELIEGCIDRYRKQQKYYQLETDLYSFWCKGLLIAGKNGHLDLVKFFLRKGATNISETLITSFPNLEIVSYLVNRYPSVLREKNIITVNYTLQNGQLSTFRTELTVIDQILTEFLLQTIIDTSKHLSQTATGEKTENINKMEDFLSNLYIENHLKIASVSILQLLYYRLHDLSSPCWRNLNQLNSICKKIIKPFILHLDERRQSLGIECDMDYYL